MPGLSELPNPQKNEVTCVLKYVLSWVTSRLEILLDKGKPNCARAQLAGPMPPGARPSPGNGSF
jgi:hypothetical protein